MKKTFRKFLSGLVTLSAIMLCSNAKTAIIEHSAIVPLVDRHTSADAWAVGSRIPTTTINLGDTFRINVKFANNEKLQWTDNGTQYEWLAFQLSPSVRTYFNFSETVSFKLHNVEGDSFVSALSPSKQYRGGHGVSGTSKGLNNFTNSQFQFSGFSVELANIGQGIGVDEQGEIRDSGFPSSFNRFSMSFIGGDFSVLKSNPVDVPEPGALSLVGLGLLSSIVTRRRRKQA